MHKFWYHSPVRFFRTLAEHEDKTNPQNSQYFGSVGNPYPLEINQYHRFLIPNDNNTVPTPDLELWVSGVRIPAHFTIVGDKLHYVTFVSLQPVSGRFEIKADNVTLFYSNCIKFMDSSDGNGRKYIRVATKHLYDRNLFLYKDRHYWTVTNLPAYSLGLFTAEVDVNNARIGGNSTLKVRETSIDESVTYEFQAEGDANVLAFIQVHSTNNEFYIDNTKRTSLAKLDPDEFAMNGRMKFTNVKDKNGYNIILDEDGVFDDVYFIYSDEIIYNYTYSHEPENDTNSGEWFLANLLFNNYFNAFGIVYNCDLKVQIESVPVKGFLAHNTTKQIFAPNDVISYCEKDNLVYYPNGFNNNLGVSGNFSETFSYKIIDQDGRIGRLTTHTLVMTDSATEPIDISVSILWNDDTSAPKTGTLGNVIVKLGSLIFDPADPVVTQQWEVWNGTEWVFYADKTADSQTIALPYEFNQIRLKVVSQYSVTAYSNVLSYTKTAVANIYITDRVHVPGSGVTTYKLHVENEPFTGFINTTGEKTANVKNSFVDNTFADRLFIPAGYAVGDIATKSKAVTIPIGVYDCELTVQGAPVSFMQDVEAWGKVAFGFTTNYADSAPTTRAETRLFVPTPEA